MNTTAQRVNPQPVNVLRAGHVWEFSGRFPPEQPSGADGQRNAVNAAPPQQIIDPEMIEVTTGEHENPSDTATENPGDPVQSLDTSLVSSDSTVASQDGGAIDVNTLDISFHPEVRGVPLQDPVIEISSSDASGDSGPSIILVQDTITVEPRDDITPADSSNGFAQGEDANKLQQVPPTSTTAPAETDGDANSCDQSDQSSNMDLLIPMRSRPYDPLYESPDTDAASNRNDDPELVNIFANADESNELEMLNEDDVSLPAGDSQTEDEFPHFEGEINQGNRMLPLMQRVTNYIFSLLRSRCVRGSDWR